MLDNAESLSWAASSQGHAIRLLFHSCPAALVTKHAKDVEPEVTSHLFVQLMHSQMTDYNSEHISPDTANMLLMAASQQTNGSKTGCLSLHSLDAEVGMFAPRFTLAPLDLADFKSAALPLSH